MSTKTKDLLDYDYTLWDLIENPPYSHLDMVKMLADGQFVIEGKESNIDDAHFYADENNVEAEVWAVLGLLTKELSN